MANPMKSVIIRDSTLREGIELPNVHLSLREKMEIVRFLESMNVPEIEIGMPYGIKDCLSLARAIKSKRLKIRTSALILSYRLTWKEEVKIAAESDIHRIEILFPASDILLNLKNYYKIRKKDLGALIRERITYAKRYLSEVGVGFVDATRTELDFLILLTQEAQEAGADRVIIYDSIGIATPPKMKKIVSSVRQNNSLQIIAHCHNDFGLATANSLASIEAGANGVDVVVNGLGDRGGNAPFEEVVLALEILYAAKTGIKLEEITELSRLVEERTGIRKALVKPIVGEFTFLHSPVMHIRNVASGNYRGFEPFKPELIGAERKYAFTLPVDYQEAVEPFFRKLGLKLKKEQKISIIKILRKESKNRGLTEKQVLAVIKRTIAWKPRR